MWHSNMTVEEYESAHREQVRRDLISAVGQLNYWTRTVERLTEDARKMGINVDRERGLVL